MKEKKKEKRKKKKKKPECVYVDVSRVSLKCFQWPLGIFNAACKRGVRGGAIGDREGKGMRARVDRQHLVSTQLVSEGMPDTCVLESGNRRPNQSGPSILSFYLSGPLKLKQCVFTNRGLRFPRKIAHLPSFLLRLLLPLPFFYEHFYSKGLIRILYRRNGTVVLYFFFFFISCGELCNFVFCDFSFLNFVLCNYCFSILSFAITVFFNFVFVNFVFGNSNFFNFIFFNFVLFNFFLENRETICLFHFRHPTALITNGGSYKWH